MRNSRETVRRLTEEEKGGGGLQLRLEQKCKKEAMLPAVYKHNQTEWNSSCSVSSAETLLYHRADNNAQGWDNRKCQLIREGRKQREMARERDE